MAERTPPAGSGAAPPAAPSSSREAARGRLREVIERLATGGQATSRSDGSTHTIFPVAIPPEEGEALRVTAIAEGAAATIEIGLGYGISTLYICAGLLENPADAVGHLAVDPHQASRFGNCGLQFLEDAGVRHLVEHIAEDSQLLLPQLLQERRRFDLAFVDANHRFDGVFVDLAYLRRLLRPGAVVFVDDYQLPAVAKAASFFVANLGWRLDEVGRADDEHHWAVLRTSTKEDTRPFHHFVDF
jgi:predicted O-methyltransferase YrrM